MLFSGFGRSAFGQPLSKPSPARQARRGQRLFSAASPEAVRVHRNEPGLVRWQRGAEGTPSTALRGRGGPLKTSWLGDALTLPEVLTCVWYAGPPFERRPVGEVLDHRRQCRCHGCADKHLPTRTTEATPTSRRVSRSNE